MPQGCAEKVRLGINIALDGQRDSDATTEMIITNILHWLRFLFFMIIQPRQGFKCRVLRFTNRSTSFVRVASTLAGRNVHVIAFEDKYLLKCTMHVWNDHYWELHTLNYINFVHFLQVSTLAALPSHSVAQGIFLGLSWIRRTTNKHFLKSFSSYWQICICSFSQQKCRNFNLQQFSSKHLPASSHITCIYTR